MSTVVFSLLRKRASLQPPWLKARRRRSFRSNAALETLTKASESKVPNMVLYNYPSFSGAFAALFARLFHSRIDVPCIILPFSSIEPFRVEDLYIEGLEKCYFLDFIGPKGFAMDLSRRSNCEVIAFDHRYSVLHEIPPSEYCPTNLKFHIDLEKSSSTAVYEFFSRKLEDLHPPDGKGSNLLDIHDRDHMKSVLKYIEDVDLRRWSLPDIREFNIGLSEWRSKLNCITNPYMYEQLLEMNYMDLIAKGNSNVTSRSNAVNGLLNKVFKVRLGRGLYGECLGVRADGNSDLSDEIGKELSIRSGAAGLRPIGAVIYMLRNNLKMSLRSTESAIDTSEIAKAYGGGGNSRSSSFIIRMYEYNQWLLENSP